MDIEKQLRKLARTFYWQKIYNCSEKIGGIFLFNNSSNFSGLQILFLHWLNVYQLLYSELSSFEWENLDEKVIDDDFRCDAFLHWRSKELEKKHRQYKKEEKKLDRDTKKKSIKDGQSLKIYSGKKGENNG